MAYDASLVLIDGSIVLTAATDTVLTSTTRSTVTGAAVIDLGGAVKARGGSIGVAHMAATLVLPSIPTTYTDTLTALIQQSDDPLNGGWETVASFPVLYAYTRLLSVLVTTAFVAGDIGQNLTGATTGDIGVIRWLHPDLLTIGKTAYMIVSMAAADDVFDDVDEAVSSAVTGAGTMNGAATVEADPMLSGPNTFIRAFDITKRYVRGNLTASATGNFGYVELLLSPYQFKNL
jgi:hypothetical protein